MSLDPDEVYPRVLRELVDVVTSLLSRVFEKLNGHIVRKA